MSKLLHVTQCRQHLKQANLITISHMMKSMQVLVRCVTFKNFKCVFVLKHNSRIAANIMTKNARQWKKQCVKWSIKSKDGRFLTKLFDEGKLGPNCTGKSVQEECPMFQRHDPINFSPAISRVKRNYGLNQKDGSKGKAAEDGSLASDIEGSEFASDDDINEDESLHAGGPTSTVGGRQSYDEFCNTIEAAASVVSPSVQTPEIARRHVARASVAASAAAAASPSVRCKSSTRTAGAAASAIRNSQPSPRKTNKEGADHLTKSEFTVISGKSTWVPIAQVVSWVDNKMNEVISATILLPSGVTDASRVKCDVSDDGVSLELIVQWPTLMSSPKKLHKGLKLPGDEQAPKCIQFNLVQMPLRNKAADPIFSAALIKLPFAVKKEFRKNSIAGSQDGTRVLCLEMLSASTHQHVTKTVGEAMFFESESDSED